MNKAELILDSIYTVEPSQAGMWEGHWNYQWSGRGSAHCSNGETIVYRYEGDGIYTVKDPAGQIWQMEQEIFAQNILAKIA